MKSARTPRCAAPSVAPPSRVSKTPTARDPDPRPLGIGRVRDDRVEDQPAVAGLPGRAGRVVRQALRRASSSRRRPRCGTGRPVRPRPGRPPSGRGGKAPDRLDRLHALAVAVGQPGRRVGPGLAEVVGPPDGRSVPRGAGRGEDRRRSTVRRSGRGWASLRTSGRAWTSRRGAASLSRMKAPLAVPTSSADTGHRQRIRPGVTPPAGSLRSAARLERVDHPGARLHGVDIRRLVHAPSRVGL